MSTLPANIRNGSELVGLNHVPAPTNLDELQRMTKMLVASGYFKGVKDLAQGAVKVLAGQEIGISPVASLQGIHFVNDRLCYEAVILGSALRRRGYSYKAVAQGDKGAAIEFFDAKGESIGVSEFTEEHAKAAGLLVKDVYKKYPRNMYWARAMANGCRWYCPDVFGGPVYVPEELDANVDADGRPVDTQVEPVTVLDTPQTDKTESLNDKLKAKREQQAALSNGGVHKAVQEALPETASDVYEDGIKDDLNM